MIVGVGTDITENDRIARIYNRFGDSFLNRVYHASEVDYCKQLTDPIPCLAARFAAKEAFVKALGLSDATTVRYKDIEVNGSQRGKKQLRLHGTAKEFLENLKVSSTHMSISHGRDSSIAVVILESDFSHR